MHALGHKASGAASSRVRPGFHVSHALAKPRRVIASASKNVARIQGNCTLDVPVSNVTAEGANLDMYMEQIQDFLPDMQLPMGGSLVRTSADQFLLTVTKMQFFHIWMQPKVPCTISQRPQVVEFLSQRCEITGSPQLQSLGLQDNLSVDARIGFTWRSPSERARDLAAPQKLSGSGTLIVDFAVPGSFGLLPRPLIEMTGSTGLNATLRIMLGSFLQTIASDYSKWVQSPELRVERRRAQEVRHLQEQQSAAAACLLRLSQHKSAVKAAARSLGSGLELVEPVVMSSGGGGIQTRQRSARAVVTV